MTDDSAFTNRLDRARGGDQAAWAELYDAYAPKLLGYLRAKGAAEPEDVLGEVFVQAVRDLESFEGAEADFRRWIFSIAHHRLIDAARQSARRPATPLPAETIELLSRSGDAEEKAIAEIGVGEVTAMLSTLSEDQRIVICLRIIGDFTVEQVAELVGKRPGAIKQLQRRGLARLKKRMAQ